MLKKIIIAILFLALIPLGYFGYRGIMYYHGYMGLSQRSVRYCFIVRMTNNYSFFQQGDVLLVAQKFMQYDQNKFQVSNELKPLAIFRGGRWQPVVSPRFDGAVPGIAPGQYKILGAEDFRNSRIPFAPIEYSAVPKKRSYPISRNPTDANTVLNPKEVQYFELAVGPVYVYLTIQILDSIEGAREEDYIYWIDDKQEFKARSGEMQRVYIEEK